MELTPKKLILPKTYLSWSQLSCWLSNPSRYRREYFENGDKLQSKYLSYGKNIATMIENGQHKELLPDLLTYDSPEFEIKCDVMGVPILSYLDSYDSKDNIFLEYKTGKIPWTKAKVQKHDQLTFYATALKWSIGKMPEYCDLIWIQTKDEVVESKEGLHDHDEQKIVNITGRIISFHRIFDEREIDRMENLIVRCANEISDAYIKYLEEQII
jgi:hypothetical protein